MMYRITYNGIEIYGPSLDMAVLNPVLETELNAAGTLTFTLPITRNDGHDAIWESIQVFRGEVQVWEGDDCIWFGRPLQIVRDWNNQKKVVCEGALAYFNDSIQVTKEYKRKQTPLYTDPDVYGNKKGFLNELIRLHNEAVRTSNNYEQYGDRQIYIDEDSIIDIDNELVWRQTDWQTTAECIQSMCLDTNGGYILLKKVAIEGTSPTQYKTVLDWRKEAPYGTSQPIIFGENLLDINQDLNGSDLCTVLYVTGPDDYVKTVEKAKNYKEDDPEHPPYEVPPEEGGKGHVLHSKPDDYIVHLEGYKKYGRIVKQKDFDLNEHDEYTEEQKANQLFKKAAKWLDDQNKDETTIEISSADLHYLPDHENYGKLRIGQKVMVHSGIHDIDAEFPIYKVSMNLDSGIKKVTIGTPPKKELTDIIKTSTSSSTRGSSGSSGSGSSDSGGGSGGGGGSTVDIPVKDVRVKNPGETNYNTVVSNKKANVDLSGLMTNIYADGQSIKALDGAARLYPGNNVSFDVMTGLSENGLRINTEGGLSPWADIKFFDKCDTAVTPGVYTVDVPGLYFVENEGAITLYKDPEIGTEITYNASSRTSITCVQNTNLSEISYKNEIHSRTTQDEYETYLEPYIGESTITIVRCYLENYQTITTENTGVACLLELEVYNPETESYELTNDQEIKTVYWRDPSDTQEKEYCKVLIDKSSRTTLNKTRRIHFRATKSANMNSCYIVYDIYCIHYPLPILNSYLTYVDKRKLIEEEINPINETLRYMGNIFTSHKPNFFIDYESNVSSEDIVDNSITKYYCVDRTGDFVFVLNTSFYTDDYYIHDTSYIKAYDSDGGIEPEMIAEITPFSYKMGEANHDSTYKSRYIIAVFRGLKGGNRIVFHLDMNTSIASYDDFSASLVGVQLINTDLKREIIDFDCLYINGNEKYPEQTKFQTTSDEGFILLKIPSCSLLDRFGSLIGRVATTYSHMFLDGYSIYKVTGMPSEYHTIIHFDSFYDYYNPDDITYEHYVPNADNIVYHHLSETTEYYYEYEDYDYRSPDYKRAIKVCTDASMFFGDYVGFKQFDSEDYGLYETYFDFAVPSYTNDNHNDTLVVVLKFIKPSFNNVLNRDKLIFNKPNVYNPNHELENLVLDDVSYALPKIEANPDGTATEQLDKIKIRDDIYSVAASVIANPGGSTSADLTALRVGGSNYAVSNVKANPSGSPTSGDLNKLEIDGSIFSIPSGGGGGGGGVTVDVLYSRSTYPSSSGASGQVRNYTMDYSIDNYDAVYIQAWTYWNKTSGYECMTGMLVFKSEYYISPTTQPNQPWSFLLNGTYNGATRQLYFRFTSNTALKTMTEASEGGNEPILYKVYGLKFS